MDDGKPPAGECLALCWGSIGQPSLTDLAAAALAGGFDAITATPAMCLAEDQRATADRLRDGDVRVAYIDPLLSALPGTPPPPDVAPEHRTFFEHGEEDCCRAAELVGATAINVAHFLGGPVAQAELVDAFGGLCERAHRRGLSLTLEFIPGTGIPDLGSALALVGAVGASNASVMLDTWHLSRSGGTVVDVAAAPSGAIGAMQLSDRSLREPEGTYVPMANRLLPGDGDLPLAALVAEVRRNRPDLVVSIEVFSDELRALPAVEAARRAGNALRGLLSRAV